MPEVDVKQVIKNAWPDVSERELEYRGAICAVEIVAYVLCEKWPRSVAIMYRSLDTVDKVMTVFASGVSVLTVVAMGLGAIPGLEMIRKYYELAREYERMVLNIYASYVNQLKAALDSFIEHVFGGWMDFTIRGKAEYELVRNCPAMLVFVEFIQNLISMLVEKVESYLFWLKRWEFSLDRWARGKLAGIKGLDMALRIIRLLKYAFEYGCRGKLG